LSAAEKNTRKNKEAVTDASLFGMVRSATIKRKTPMQPQDHDREKRVLATIKELLKEDTRPTVDGIIERMKETYGVGGSTREVRPIVSAWKDEQHKQVDVKVQQVLGTLKKLNTEQRVEFSKRLRQEV